MMMTRTIRISAAAHKAAKRKANRAGFKLYRLIEAAIESYTPPAPNAPRPADATTDSRT